MASVVNGSFHFAGHLSASSMTIPDNSIGDSSIRTGEAIGSEKLEHQIYRELALSNHATTPSVERRFLHCAYAAGEIVSFSIGCTVAPTGADTVTVQLKKNGTNLLTGNVVLDSGNANFIPEDGTPTTPTYSAGDVFEIDVSAVSGTTAKGLFVRLIVKENPTP